MSRLPLILFVAAACGGSPKPATAPLPPDSTAQAAKPATSSAQPAQPDPAPQAEPAAPVEPPMPAGPVEVKIPAAQTTVKMVSDGKGNKQPLRYTVKSGAKQALEVAMDFSGRQDQEEDVVPTIVLTGEAEAKAVEKDGSAQVTLTVTGVDIRTATPSDTVDKFKAVLGTLSGLTIGGKRGANGATGEVTMRLEHPPSHARDALELIRLTFPTLPVLPSQALGVGAKWQSTTAAKLADKLDITQVTDYEVVSHAGKTWTIKGTTKISGKDQQIENAKISAISGGGTSETTIADGAPYPSHKASLETQFKASDGDKSTQFVIKVGGAVTPK